MVVFEGTVSSVDVLVEVVDGAASWTENDFVGVELKVCEGDGGTCSGVILEKVADVAGDIVVLADDDGVGKGGGVVLGGWTGRGVLGL